MDSTSKHHYRVDATGPGHALDALLADLASWDDPPVVGDECLVLATARAPSTWIAVSRRHPAAVLGIEHFEAFGHELSRFVVERGSETILDRRGVLPEGWGSVHDEDGARLDAGLLRAAAESVAEGRGRYGVGTLSSGIDTAITVGGALGRFCSLAEPTMWMEPAGDTLDAVVELAVLALHVSVAGRSLDSAERGFEHELRLTRSVAHAGISELSDRPGNANWLDWLETLVSSTAGVIDAACHCRSEPATDLHAIGSEHLGPEDAMELEAGGLLTACLQALALFAGGVVA
jgi:hypothetical protein